jgi:hypothetical protein
MYKVKDLTLSATPDSGLLDRRLSERTHLVSSPQTQAQCGGGARELASPGTLTENLFSLVHSRLQLPKMKLALDYAVKSLP